MLVLSALFACVCVAAPQAGFRSDGPPSVFPALAPVRNLGFVGSQHDYTDGRVIRVVWESSQGAIDLNGDGQANDKVAVVVGSGPTIVLGDTFFGFRVVGDRILFVKSEFGDGLVDLNADGDKTDGILHVFDGVALTNLGLTSSLLNSSGEHALFLALERSGAGAGTDLNGDGDTLDGVWHHYDASTGVLTNLQLATPGSGNSTGPALGPAHGLFFVSESAQAATDLNGDGDATDTVAHLFFPASVTSTNLAVAVDPKGIPAVAGELLAFALSEAGQGVDANGDGDQLDSVPQIRDLSSATTFNTGVAAFTNSGFGFPAAVLCDVSAAVVSSDWSLHFFDASSGITTSVGLQIDSYSLLLAGGHFVFRAYEFAGDLNGDGDADDLVLHALHESGGAATNTGLTAESPLHAAGGWVAFLVKESFQGFIDRNGDGDWQDTVVALLDLRTLTTRNTSLALHPAGGNSVIVSPSLAAVSVLESAQGDSDLDGDGDTDDSVVHLIELSSGRRRNTGLSGAGLLTRGSRLYLDVAENPGGSLNGDGDTSDAVLHSLRVLP